MKFVWIFLIFISLSTYAQDAATYLNSFDSKIFSLKSKGVKDIVFDLESSKLTKQMNDQQIFGKVENLFFRIYWTASPERLAIEINGLPEGFKEIKEELKLSVVPLMDNIFPQTISQRFAGYKLSIGTKAKEFVAQDLSGVAPVPSYVLKFDEEDKLIEINGVKPIGSLMITPIYEKESFSDGKWVLKSLMTVNSENGQILTTKKEIEYQAVQGVSLPEEVSIVSEQKSISEDVKPISFNEKIVFKNYKVNAGDALKYFLVNTPKP